MLPPLLAVLPGLVAGFAGAGNGEGAPRLLAGVEVGGVDPAADAELAAGAADDREIANDQRGEREGLGDRRIRDLALPHHLAGRLVEREQAAVERDRDDLVLPQRHAAVVDAAAGHVAGPGAVGAGVELPLDQPFLAAGDVDGVDRAPAVGHVHHAVFDDRGGLQVAVLVAAAALIAAERHGECHPEILDVLGVDLLELREPPAFVVAVMQQPVVRFLADVERALVGHVGRLHGRERSRREQRTRQGTSESQSLHGNPPVIAGASWPGNYSLLLASCISVNAIPQCGKRSPVCNRRSISHRCMAEPTIGTRARATRAAEQATRCSSGSFGP